jgi:hypothetical protein
MSKVYVLDTETKGTGANVVPLDRAERKPAVKPDPVRVPPKLRRREKPEAPPAESRRFKVVDVMTKEVLAEDTDVRATVEELRRARSTVDVNVYVWQPDSQRWRLLGYSEQQALWRLR